MDEAMIASDEEPGDRRVHGASSSSSEEEDMGGEHDENRDDDSTPDLSSSQSLEPEGVLSSSDEASRAEAAPAEEGPGGGGAEAGYDADDSASSSSSSSSSSSQGSPHPSPAESPVLHVSDNDDGLPSPRTIRVARQIRAEGEEFVGEDEGNNKNKFNPDMIMHQEHPSAPRSPKQAALKNTNEDTDVVEDGSSSNAGIVVMQQETNRNGDGSSANPSFQWEGVRLSAFKTVVRHEVRNEQMKAPPAAHSVAAVAAAAPGLLSKRKADQLSGCPTGSSLSGVASKKAPGQVAFPSAVAAASSMIASSGSIQPDSLQLPGKNDQNDTCGDAKNDGPAPQQAEEHEDTHGKDKTKN